MPLDVSCAPACGGGALAGSRRLQFAALVSGSFEVWFALRLFGHPISASAALILESMTQAVRHLAFVVPAGLGVQEAGLVIFGHALGISSELALAVSMAKRMREVLCGLPALLRGSGWKSGAFEGRFATHAEHRCLSIRADRRNGGGPVVEPVLLVANGIGR